MDKFSAGCHRWLFKQTIDIISSNHNLTCSIEIMYPEVYWPLLVLQLEQWVELCPIRQVLINQGVMGSVPYLEKGFSPDNIVRLEAYNTSSIDIAFEISNVVP
ncbi:hypothetical protein FRC18_005375 [Serendipita sp. 400]|nr:hypothetical protein FRC18_005375 [Serendipita sp. 400]